ncbi:MAG: DMT family transporter [Aliishimia sp.]
MNPNISGALFMMASMFSFTVNDAFIKMTNGAIPLCQLLLFRGALATVLFFGLAVALRGLRFDLGRKAWGLVLMRCGAEVGAAYFFLTALLHLPLANVSAVLQALPLAVTLGAFLVFKEPVGWRRAGAIIVGFFGMLLIVRPGADGFSIWSIYALIAVCFVTARDLITRKLPKDAPSLTVALSTSAAVTVFFGVASLSEPWVALTPNLTWLICGSAFFILGGYFFSIQTMRVGEVSFVAPFRYTSLIWALLLGFFVFGDWPETLTFVGAGIIVSAGLFTFYRERHLARS